MTKECPSGPSQIDTATQAILSVTQTEWIPNFAFRNDDIIFNTLVNIESITPQIETLTAGVIKTEALIIYQNHADEMTLAERMILSKTIQSLPQLPPDIIHEPLFDDFDFFLLEHDVATPFNNATDEIFIRHKEYLPFIKKVQECRNIYTKLRYRYQEAIEINQTNLAHAYLQLLKEFITQAVLPSISDTLRHNLPIGIFELYELRSAFRELVNINPLTYAKKIPIQTTLKEFIAEQSFIDKNSHKPVKVKFTDTCENPNVLMDPGDLFRMTRNLLRDAVTHGDGEVITPIIHIEQQGEVVMYSIFSPGHLDAKTLSIIGKLPYTTQDRGETPHGYGKVGARKLISALWKSLGTTPDGIEKLLDNHWSNTFIKNARFVQWNAPLPLSN